MKNVKGFTLIEILLVVSIIGLMSSVVLSSVNTAREKAHVAAIKQFSSGVENLLGNDMDVEFEFDNNRSQTSIHNFQSITPIGFTEGYSYVDGPFGESLKFIDKSYFRLRYSPISIKKGTIEILFKQTEVNPSGTYLVSNNDYTPQLRLNNDSDFYVYWMGATGMAGGGNSSRTYSINVGGWNDIIFTWTSDYKSTGHGYYEIYINGDMVEKHGFTPYWASHSSQSFNIAANQFGLIGYFDRFRIYDAPLFDNE